MIGLDTNVLVRYLAQDNVTQSAVATRLIERELSAAQPGFISLVVLTEPGWVLKRLYGASETELLIAQIALAQGCSHTVSSDKTAVRSAGMKLLG